MNAREHLARPGLKLITRAAPADLGAVNNLRSAAPMSLPAAYLELLRTANGLEGELGIQPGWVQLWPAEDVLSMNADYEVTEFHPGFFGFGSSGGGVMFAFALASGAESSVFGVPFDSVSPEDVSLVAATVLEFISALGETLPDGGA